MIDIHSHILPGIDDGAQDLAEAIAMAQVAAADGLTAIIATPHSTDVSGRLVGEDIRQRVQLLQEAIAQAGIAIEVYPGLEDRILPDLAQQLQDGIALTLNGSRYVLVELPLQGYPLYTEEALFALQLKGYRPIIAHPERNGEILRDLGLLTTLVERGMLAQVTAASLTGAFGKAVQRAAQEMVRRRLVHVIASDAHAPHPPRSPVLSEAVAIVAQLVGQEAARDMVEALPRAILAGKPVLVEPPLPPPKRSRFAFWRR